MEQYEDLGTTTAVVPKESSPEDDSDDGSDDSDGSDTFIVNLESVGRLKSGFDVA